MHTPGVGDSVYVKRRATDTLDCSASPVILQILQIRPDYKLVLRGRGGRVISDHTWNTAPCFLPDFSDEYDPARVRPDSDHRCEVCHCINSPDTTLLCDGCNLGYHMECMNPPLVDVPLREWLCPNHVET